MDDKNIRESVKNENGNTAKQSSCYCSGKCCSASCTQTSSEKLGYSTSDTTSTFKNSCSGHNCGSSHSSAGIKEGDTVLDLGSGAGFDCFSAAKSVGNSGKVIGIDTTEEMIARARRNAEKGGYKNVEFLLGEIEKLPVADNSVDVIISNCVINLSPDKNAVFNECYRVLKPGGRLLVSDIVTTKDVPDFVRSSQSAYISCIAGAINLDKYIEGLKNAGFKSAEVVQKSSSNSINLLADPVMRASFESAGINQEDAIDIMNSVISARIKAEK